MKIWVDDVRPAPDGYIWCKSVNDAKYYICYGVKDDTKPTGRDKKVELIDLDHDAGDYACDGGDFIKLLDWCEETNRDYPIHIHSMNPVGVQNMRAIIQHNGWKEI